jgi:predicted phosphohydrolase
MSTNTFDKRRKFLKLGASVPVMGLIGACGSEDLPPSANFSPATPTQPTETPPVDTPPPIETPPVFTPASHAPRGVHAALFNDAATSRALCWFTDGIDSPASEIQWGAVPQGMSLEAAKNAAQNPLPNSNAASTNQTTGLENQTHKVVVNGIDPEQPFRYRVGSDAGGWSEVFVISPTPKVDDTWTMVHFGDHGIGALPQRLTAELMKPQHRHDLLLLAGDLSYANGDHAIWDTWFDQNQALLASTTTMAVPGNHENKDSVAADVPLLPLKDYAFNNRFNQPGDVSFFSFDYNRVHFFGFTAGAFLEDGKILKEMATLEADLAMAAVRRALGQIDFIVIFQHYTIWTDQEGRAPGNPSLIAVEDQILLRYGVDLVLCGHDHVYQRSKPMVLGMPNSLGYVQVMTGTGGQSIREFEPEISAWSEKHFVGLGFSKYTISPGKIISQYFGTPPLSSEDRSRVQHESVESNFELIDEFEISPRPLRMAKSFVKPPRTEIELAKAHNWPAIYAHTLARNCAHENGVPNGVMHEYQRAYPNLLG